MVEKEIKITVDTSDAEKDVKALDKTVEKFGDTAEDSGKRASDSLDSVNESNKDIKSSSKGASLGVRAIGTALKAIGIGIVIALVAKFTEVLTSNKKISDTLSTVFETISIVLNQTVGVLVDAISTVYEASNGFENLRKVIGGLITVSLTPLLLIIDGVKLAFYEAQLAYEQSFLGDNDPTTINRLRENIQGVKDDVKETAQEYLQAGEDIVSGFSGAVNEVTSLSKLAINGLKDVSISASFEQAKANVQLANSAELAEAQIQGLIEKYDRQAEKLRQVRDDDRKSIKERIEANEELGRVLDEQEKAQKRLAGVRIASAQAELDKNKGSIEAQRALIEAQNELAGIEAQVEGFRSEQLTNRNSLLREQQDIVRELNKIGKDELELQREEARELRDDRLAQIELQIEDEKERARLLLAVQEDYQNTLNDIESKNAKAREQIAEKEIKAKEDQLNSYGESVGQFSEILGAETAQGKALAVASALASTYAGANDALTDKTIPNTFARIAAVAAVIGTGLANVKQILSIKVPSAGGASANQSASSGGATQSQPAFNLVGRSTVNQLQTGLEQQETAPIQAFVVSSEVTSAQEADRATEIQASFG